MPGLGLKEKKEFINTVGLHVSKFLTKTYLPVLIFLHEHWLENLCEKEMDKKEKRSIILDKFGIKGLKTKDNGETLLYNNKYLNIPEIQDKPLSTVCGDEIESRLKWLWQKRQSLKKNIKASLIFTNYLVCSESMVDLVFKVITTAQTLKKQDNGMLPACIFVGGAGSGKEKLSKILRLFSEEFFEGEEFVINMASIRPGPLTATVMVGMELDKRPKIDIKGILQRAREAAKGPFVIRLDEFNSMDPDSQGILLRFLDNTEIVSIGGLEDKIKEHTNCLVIGIMNEDPSDISRERAMDFIRDNPYLGGFLGDLLYEHFHQIRRLRPDVMYRMLRNGKFVIPPLKERREDIPLLFYVYLNKEIDSKNGESKLHLTLDVLNKLTSTELIWPGNIRQLQAVAKIVVENLARYEHKKIITLPVLEDALYEVGLITKAKSKDE